MTPSPTSAKKCSDRPEVRWSVSFATGYLQLGMLKQASAELRNLSLRFQCCPDVLDVRIQILLARKCYRKAARLAAVAIRLYASQVDFYIYGATAWEKLGCPEKAKAFWLAAPALYRDSGFFYYNIARCEEQMGDHMAARQHMAQAVKLDPAIQSEMDE